MGYYLPAYDTEAVYPWWEFMDGAGSPLPYQLTVSYEGERLRECLDGIRAVAEVQRRMQAPATFFLVGELLVHSGPELRAILDDPLFDIQSHSYTHPNLVAISADAASLRHELADSRRLIEDTFGRPVIGLTTPGGFTGGLAGQRRVLDAIVEAGYRYVRSAGRGADRSVPAPLTQPFWYEEDGYPELLELALHGWHDNILTGQPGVCAWPPALPWGYPSRMPRTAREVYQAYAPGIDYVAEHRLLTYVPCFHPWSIYRVDARARQIELLLRHAQRRIDIISCTGMYEQLCTERAL